MTYSAPVTTCYRHPGREAGVRCTRCDRPICPDCMREASVGFQCPECVAQGRRTQRPVRTAFGGSSAGLHGYATITLIATNVLMFLLSLASAGNVGRAVYGGGLGGLLGGTTPLLYKLAVIGPSFQVSGNQISYQTTTHLPGFTEYVGVADGNYYRLVTAMFMHYGLLHLAMNMWALWILGRDLEAALGPVRFLALYLICGLGGNVAAYLFQPEALSAGASTAIFGLFSALFLVLRRLGRNASAVLPVIVINLIFTLTVPGISIAGHLGGLVTGGLVGAGLAYAPRANRGLVQAGVCVAALLLLVALTVVGTNRLTG
ncbi:MAG TPA: rhomboid family intramembrane serine protease [Rugosimonospora sp.]|nr:rhomboid family intramembrane serine protease [Rugosimonospora sp.]